MIPNSEIKSRITNKSYSKTKILSMFKIKINIKDHKNANKYWVGNLVLSQKFGNFSRTNAAFSKLVFVIFQYHQTVSLHPHMHRTV